MCMVAGDDHSQPTQDNDAETENVFYLPRRGPVADQECRIHVCRSSTTSDASIDFQNHNLVTNHANVRL